MRQDVRPEVRSAQRRATYDFNERHAALARQAQDRTGRWCLTVLAAIHAGALLAAAGLDQGPPSARWWAAAGLGLALLSGLALWTHWTFMALVHTRWADDRLLDPEDDRPVDEPKARKRIADLAWAVAMACAAAAAIAAPIALLRLGDV